jgi:hypothetical protein
MTKVISNWSGAQQRLGKAPDFKSGEAGYQADTAGKGIRPSLGSRFKPV